MCPDIHSKSTCPFNTRIYFLTYFTILQNVFQILCSCAYTLTYLGLPLLIQPSISAQPSRALRILPSPPRHPSILLGPPIPPFYAAVSPSMSSGTLTLPHTHSSPRARKWRNAHKVGAPPPENCKTRTQMWDCERTKNEKYWVDENWEKEI